MAEVHRKQNWAHTTPLKEELIVKRKNAQKPRTAADLLQL